VRWRWWQAAVRWRAPLVIECRWDEVNDGYNTLELLNDAIGAHYPHRRRRIGGDGGGRTIYRRWGKPGVLAAHGCSVRKVCTSSTRGSVRTGWSSWPGWGGSEGGGWQRAHWVATVVAKREGRISEWCLNTVGHSAPLRGETGKRRAGIKMTATEGATVLR
jgi:hypothetical protein